jgi:Tetracyclin repressor-like, C-terminal domain
VPLQAVVASNTSKLEELRKAIAKGVLPERFAPVELLALVRAAALCWFTTIPELGPSVPKARERRRAVVVETVRRLVAFD